MATEKQEEYKGCMGILLTLLVLIVVGYFVGGAILRKRAERSHAEYEARQAQQMEQQAADTRRRNQPIVVKGLYIGMPVSELPSVVATKFVGWTLLFGNNFATARDFSIMKTADLGIEGVRVVCDGTRKVILIQFDPKAAEYAFNAQNMTARQFATSFMDSFHLDQLEPRGSLWELYRPQDKVLLRISTDKEVTLQYLEDPAAIKPSFK